jgi:hypothetical protein
VIAALVKEAIASMPMTHPEVTGELLTLQRLPCLSPEKLSLSRTLHLTPDEMSLLQGIFQKWHFSSDILLLTLMGVDLYQDLLALQLPPKSHDLVLHSFAPHFFDIYLRFDRDNIANIGSRQLIPTKGAICENLEACKQFVSQVAGAANPAVRNIGCKIDLLTKILQAKHGKLALADKKLLNFQDVDMPDHRTSKSRQSNIKDLQRYAEFCHAMVTAAHKKKMFKEPYTAFQQLAQFCERAHESFDPQVVGEIKTYLCKTLHSSATELLKSNEAVEKAKNGRDMRLNLGRKQLHTNLDTLTQTLETLSTRNIIACNLDFLVSEFQLLFDYQVIIPSFPNFAPIISNMQRFLLNMGNCAHALPKHKAKKVPEGQISLVADFEKHLSAKLSSIEGICRPLMQNAMFQFYQTEDARVTFQETFQVGYWIAHLSPLQKYCDLLPEIKRRLAVLPEELMAFLQTQVAQLPVHVTAEERRALCDEVTEVCFRKSTFLTRILMILDDLDTILNNRFVPEPKYIPTELEDVMILTGLEELFSRKPEEIAGESEQALSTMAEIEPETVTPAGNASVVIHTVPPANTLPPGVVKGIGLQRPLPKPKVYPPVSSDLTRLTKTKKILKMLRDSGFFEAKDKASGHENPDHTIVADEHGRIVSVPRRYEQKPGTVKSMYEQATAPLHEGKK